MTWLPVEVTAAPATEPLSVADATAQVRADAGDTEDQAYILALTKAARAHVESYTGLKLVSQTVKFRRADWSDELALPVAPVTAITGVEYLDTAAATQTLATTVYGSLLYGLTPKIYLKINQSWPSLYDSPVAVVVTATVGFTTLPAEIGHAMKLLVSQWYDNRAAVNVGNIVNELPNAVAALLSNWRIYAF